MFYTINYTEATRCKLTPMSQSPIFLTELLRPCNNSTFITQSSQTTKHSAAALFFPLAVGQGRKESKKAEGDCYNKLQCTGELQCSSLTVYHSRLSAKSGIIASLESFLVVITYSEHTHLVTCKLQFCVHVSLLTAHFHNTVLVYNTLPVCQAEYLFFLIMQLKINWHIDIILKLIWLPSTTSLWYELVHLAGFYATTSNTNHA